MSLLALAPVAAMAVSPSPHVIERAKKDPALRKRIQEHFASARNKGIDSFAVKTYGPGGHLVPGSKASGPAYSIQRTSPVARVLASAAASAAASADGAGPSQSPALSPSPTVFRQLVLLVDFSDKPASEPASFYDNLMFKDVTGPASVRGYYREVSAGKLDMQGVAPDLPSALGWLRMPRTYSYYVNGNYGTDSPYPHNAQKLFEDAAAAAQARGVDFSQYDNDGDGYIDGVVMIHAGRGAEFTENVNDIWSHQWVAQSSATYDGKQLGVYTTEPEYWQSVGDMTTGVICHELGHSFGLPDLYDTDYSSMGLGKWSIMASGSWNGPGSLGGSPARFDAWCLTQLGFSTATPVTGTVVPETIAGASPTTEGTILRIAKHGAASGSEYFLVENRRLANTDAYLPAAGMLVWHIDDSINSDTPNDLESHPKVALEEAHGGVQHLRQTTPFPTNQGDAGDPFPGSSNKRLFDDSTDPSAAYYSGASGVRIASISSSANTMTAVITPDVPASLADTAPPVTTSDALSSYDGTATIHLNATDASSAVASTSYRLDSGPTVNSTTIVSGTSGPHVLKFWSTDAYGNVEATNTVSFSVNDIDPPSVTSDATSSYVQPATIHITGHDNANGSGVGSVSYVLDADETQTVSASSASLTVDAVGDHTLTFWATDLSGNDSTVATAAFSIVPPTVLHISTLPKTVVAGTLISIAGTVTSSVVPPAGQHVRLQKQLVGGAWTNLSSVDTTLDADGNFKIGRVSVSYNTTFRVIARTDMPGDELTAGASNSLVVKAKAKLTRPVLSRTTPTRYKTFTVSGTVTPRHKSSVVVYWYKVSSSGARTRYGSGRTVGVSGTTGRWSLAKALARGRWAVRAKHADPTHALSYSAYRTFSVN